MNSAEKQFGIRNELGIHARIASEDKLLLKAGQRRIRPQLDDKILLGWNALMNIAYSKAFAASGNEHYLDTGGKEYGIFVREYLCRGRWDFFIRIKMDRQNIRHFWMIMPI